MHSRWIHCAALVALWLIAGDAGKSDGAEQSSPEPVSEPQRTQPAVERALAFLATDATKWRKDHGCATCHHGTMTVWALSEAKNQGYAVDAEALANTIRWTKEQFVPRFSKPRDERPGWNLVSVPAIYLGVMSQSLPILSRHEINLVAVHLARHQEADGAWLMPPPANGAPPTWESRETLALLAYLAWEPYVPADPLEAAAARASREKAADWLNKIEPTKTVQSAALRLLLDIRRGTPATQLQPQIDQLLGRQHADGGWSQTADLPSDAYATGQTLWVLSFAGMNSDRAEIRRAVSFLVASQREDGSWAMVSRNHPEVTTTRKPIRSPIPITYFGSAWGTLGLVRCVPPALDPLGRQQQAFDAIRKFAGTFKVDEKSPGKPVVSVRVVFEVEDEDLAGLVTLLTAFPQLTSLHFKSQRITDAGLAPLQRLSQLRSVSLETAAITDAGLMRLKTLTYLEELNLKGTKVTDAGVQDFQQALPKAIIAR
jgi:Squalene-hopene cyclase N-terminal domain